MPDSIISIDPAQIDTYSKEQLVEAYAITCEQINELTAQKDSLRDILLDKIEGNGEVVGTRTVSVQSRNNFFPGLKTKEKLEKARELGAITEAVDTAKLKTLWQKGAEIPNSPTRYILVKEIEQSDKPINSKKPISGGFNQTISSNPEEV